MFPDGFSHDLFGGLEDATGAPHLKNYVFGKKKDLPIPLYYSHTTPIRIRKDMGMVWEDYHNGVPLLGVPGITLDFMENLLVSEVLGGELDS